MGGGPEDDIAIIYLLAGPILIHGFLVAKYGCRPALMSGLILFGFIAGICLMRHFEIQSRVGYSPWHAKRSLESLMWSIPWFAASLSFFLIRKNVEENKKASQKG